MLPSVFDAVVFEANQFQLTNVSPDLLVSFTVPKLKPSLSNDVKVFAFVTSVSVLLELIYFVAVLTLSKR